MRALLVVSLLLLTACGDAQLAKVEALGSDADIKCYSGGKMIFEGRSSGRVFTEDKSDGWFWKDSQTGKLVRSNGDCVIIN